MVPVEIWKDIPGWKGNYQASNLGRIRSIDRVIYNSWGMPIKRKGKVLKEQTTKDGYKITALSSKENGKFQTGTHRLIAATFHTNIFLLPEVNHINTIRSDNRAVNLEWVTKSENIAYTYETGNKVVKGERNPSAKLLESQVQEIKDLYRTGNYSYASLGRHFGVGYNCIASIIKSTTWSHTPSLFTSKTVYTAEESLRRLKSNILMNNNPAIGIIQCKNTGEVVDNFISLSEAAQKTGFARISIKNHVENSTPFKGFLWKIMNVKEQLKLIDARINKCAALEFS